MEKEKIGIADTEFYYFSTFFCLHSPPIFLVQCLRQIVRLIYRHIFKPALNMAILYFRKIHVPEQFNPDSQINIVLVSPL